MCSSPEAWKLWRVYQNNLYKIGNFNHHLKNLKNILPRLGKKYKVDWKFYLTLGFVEEPPDAREFLRFLPKFSIVPRKVFIQMRGARPINNTQWLWYRRSGEVTEMRYLEKLVYANEFFKKI